LLNELAPRREPDDDALISPVSPGDS